MTNKELKSILQKECSRIVEERHQRVKQSIIGIEESLFEESKSSAGDKHETGRAMLQIERENKGKQLQVVEKTLQALKRIANHTTSDTAHLGSLVFTTIETYFISVSVGVINVQSKNYIAVSPMSPIGMTLMGKKEGAGLSFNGNEFRIIKVV